MPHCCHICDSLFLAALLCLLFIAIKEHSRLQMQAFPCSTDSRSLSSLMTTAFGSRPTAVSDELTVADGGWQGADGG
jgi:hypothetical protein